MRDVIHLLPDSIANQIAAGEVIQRPASAVKELLENAVDAGATEIQLIVRESGKGLIQVIDNGCGMSQTDARLCFERHATSKIQSAEDLFSVRTMGFRGEALASIASIAHVEMKTRLPSEDLGTRILIEGFDLKLQEPFPMPAGTNISVKNLFFNVPARRNFLKSNTVELKHILEEFERVALANPDIFFSLHHNGVELFHLKKGTLRQRIVQLFGNAYLEKLVPVEEKTSVTNISGFISKPDSAKKTRGEQFFFVNNRYIRSPYLHHAVMQVYEELVPDGSFPLYVICIQIDPSRIDVNVHPTKQEIKFEDERIIYTFIHAAIRHALAQYSITPTLDFEQDPTFANLPAFYTKRKEEGPQENFRTLSSRINEWPERDVLQKTLIPRDPLPAQIPATGTGPLQPLPGVSGVATEVPAYQLHGQYVITPIKSGFILIDQQAAHERILYERYLARLRDKKHFSQQQLFPRTIQLSASDAQIFSAILPDINTLGFDIEPFGQNTFVLHGIPMEFEELDDQKVIEDLLEQFKENKNALQLNRHETIARSMARSNAIRSGTALQLKSMQALIDELFACETPYVSPAGTRTFITFTFDDLAKQFQKSKQ